MTELELLQEINETMATMAEMQEFTASVVVVLVFFLGLAAGLALMKVFWDLLRG